MKKIDSKKIILKKKNIAIGEINNFKNEELQRQIKKFILFINLYKNGQIYNKNILLFEKCYNLAQEINQFIEKKDYNVYKNIIINLNNDLNLFEILDYCIPKKKFEDIDLKYAYLWLDLFSCFYKEKVNFSIIFNNNENLKFEFNEGKKTLNPEFDIEKNFKLSKKSNFNLEDKKELGCQNEYSFYFILKQLSKYKSPSKKDICNELKNIKKGEILNKEIWDKLIINPNVQLYNLFYIKDKKLSKMKFIWLLVYYLDENMLEYFENSITKLEMDWVKIIKSKLTKIDDIETIIEASKEIEQFLKECKEFENIINGKNIEKFDSLSKEQYLEEIKKEDNLFELKKEYFKQLNLENYSKYLQEQKINFEKKINIFQNDIKSSHNIKIKKIIKLLNKEIEKKTKKNIEIVIYNILINY